ncbi:MAG: hypothetical protein ACKO39_14615 [Chthoniobacterales bacterium]
MRAPAERSRELAAQWTDEAIAALRPFGRRAQKLRALAALILDRDR